MPTKTTGIDEQVQKLKRQNRSYKKKDGKISYNGKSSDPAVCLNGKTVNKEGKKNVCRHLSDLMIEMEFKKWQPIFTDKDTLAKQERLQNNEHDKKSPEAKSAHYHLGNIHTVGELLHDIAKNLTVNETATYYVVSPPKFRKHEPGHEMAVSVQCLQGGTVKIKFFDPNKTGVVAKILCANLEEVEKITGNQLIKNTYLLNSYFGFNPAVALASKKKIAAGKEATVYFSQAFPSMPEYKDRESLTHYLGQPKIARYFCEKYDNKPTIEAFSDPRENTSLALWIQAIAENNIQRIKVYGEISKYLSSAPDLLTYMFTARFNGKSAVIKALYGNHQTAVEEYMKLLESADFPADRKAEILLSIQNDQAFLNLPLEKQTFFNGLATAILSKVTLSPEQKEIFSPIAIQQSLKNQQASLQPYWDNIHNSLKDFDKNPDHTLAHITLLLKQLETEGILQQANTPLVMQALTEIFKPSIDNKDAKKIAEASRAMNYYPRSPILLTDTDLAAKYRQWIPAFATITGKLSEQESFRFYFKPLDKLSPIARTAAKKFMQETVIYESLLSPPKPWPKIIPSPMAHKLDRIVTLQRDKKLHQLALPLAVQLVLETDDAALAKALFRCSKPGKNNFPRKLCQNPVLLTRIISEGGLSTLEALQQSGLLDSKYLDAEKKYALKTYAASMLEIAKVEKNLDCYTDSFAPDADPVKRLQQAFAHACGYIADNHLSPSLQARLDNLHNQLDLLEKAALSSRKSRNGQINTSPASPKEGVEKQRKELIQSVEKFSETDINSAVKECMIDNLRQWPTDSLPLPEYSAIQAFLNAYKEDVQTKDNYYTKTIKVIEQNPSLAYLLNKISQVKSTSVAAEASTLASAKPFADTASSAPMPVAVFS